MFNTYSRATTVVRDNPNTKPSEIQPVSIISAFRKQLDWHEVEKKVESTLHRNSIANTKKKVKREMEPIGHDFEAVAVFLNNLKCPGRRS